MLQEVIVTNNDTLYRRRPPRLYNAAWIDCEFELFFRSVISRSYVSCPAEGYHVGRNAFIYEAKHIFEEGAFHPISTVDFSDALRLAEFVKPRVASGEYGFCHADGRLDVLFCKAGAGNYGHFLAECGPRLLNLESSMGPFRLHIPRESVGFAPLIMDVCEFLGLDVEIRVGKTAELLYLDYFIYLSSVSLHNQRKSRTFARFRDMVLEMYGIQHSYDRQIAVVRSGAEGRCIGNWDEIVPELKQRGYELFHPGHFTFKEQVKLFASAGKIFGSLGAGFTNAIWAGKDCITHMVDPGLADFFFWDACAQLGQNFRWQFAGVAQPWNYTLSIVNFDIDLDATLTVLDINED